MKLSCSLLIFIISTFSIAISFANPRQVQNWLDKVEAEEQKVIEWLDDAIVGERKRDGKYSFYTNGSETSSVFAFPIHYNIIIALIGFAFVMPIVILYIWILTPCLKSVCCSCCCHKSDETNESSVTWIMANSSSSTTATYGKQNNSSSDQQPVSI